MQQGNFPPNPYQSSPPFAPKAVPFSPHSPDFLRPRGPRFWQPSVRCSTLRHPGDCSNLSTAPPSGHSPSNSPHGSDNSDPHYIPLNSSQESSPAGQRGTGWTPKWRGRDRSVGSYHRHSSSPGDRFNQHPGFGRSRGWRSDKMNTSSPRGWKSSPSHSDNIQNYVSPRCFQDPWEELVTRQEEPPPTTES